jgi:putative tryptophan/tyrosine transport system permease protein
MLKFLMIIFEQSLIYLPLVVGSYVSFSLLKVPDLSLESAYLIGAFAGGLALQALDGYALPIVTIVTLLAAIVGGMIVGVTSSCMTRFGNIPHLLSAIITFGLYQGLFLMFSSVYVSLARYTNVLMLFPYVDKHPEIITLLVINFIVCLCALFLFRTQLGYSFAIFGQNPDFFKYFKISTNYVFITGVMIANGLAGLAGLFFAQTNSLIEMNMGVGKGLFCITVLILGKAVFYHAKNSMMIPVVGTALYFFIQQFLLKVGFNLKYFTAIQSLLVLVILLTIYKKNQNKYDQLGV